MKPLSPVDRKVAQPMTPMKRFLGAIDGIPLDRPPVWLMRQAGRYLASYQAVKQKFTFHEMCRLPDVAAEVSIQPIEQFGMDAVIVFNDILIPLEPMGFRVEYAEGGPEVSPAFRSESDLKRLRQPQFEEEPAVCQSIREIRKRLGEDVPVLGFAGAPFTLAAYMVEGVTTKTLRHIKTLRYENPKLLQTLLERSTESVIEYLRLQARAGATAVQIFDTWAGSLSQSDYRRFALPYQKEIIHAIQSDGTPVILYVKSSAHVLPEMRESGARALSVDWLTDLSEARERLGNDITLQGNLDPTALYGPPETVAELTRSMLAQLGGKRHIANLGHGILPETPVDSVRAFVDAVKAYDLT